MFPEGKLYEDICTSHKLLHFSNAVAVSSYPMYYYRLCGGSIMRSKLTCKKCIDALDALRLSLDDYYFWGINDIAAKKLAQFFRTAIVLYCNTKEIPTSAEKNKARESIKERYNLCWNVYQGKLHLPIYKWLVFYLFRFFPKVSSCILKKIRKF